MSVHFTRTAIDVVYEMIYAGVVGVGEGLVTDVLGDPDEFLGWEVVYSLKKNYGPGEATVTGVIGVTSPEGAYVEFFLDEDEMIEG